MNTLPTSVHSAARLNSKFWLRVLAVAGFLLAPQFIFIAMHRYDSIVEYFFGYNAIKHEFPVDFRCGWSTPKEDIDCLSDWGYDTARECVRMLTLFSSFVSTYFAVKIAFKKGFGIFSRKSLLTGLAVQYGVPIFVHLLGTFGINNYAQLGGGL